MAAPFRHVRFTLPAQPVDATEALISLLEFRFQGLPWPFVEMTGYQFLVTDMAIAGTEQTQFF
jgi:hypothetical protein